MTEEQTRWRESKIMDVGACDLCGSDAIAYLCIHEIARGIHRAKAMTAAYAQLILCDTCHRYWAHRGGKVAEQLARLRFVRAVDYDLEEFYTLTDRRWPDSDDVDAAYMKLLTGAKE